MKKRTWLITGVSSGIGKALARHVMAQGDFVVGTLRHQTQIDEFNQQAQQKGLAIYMDLSQPESIQNGFIKLQQEVSRVEVLVNNAGFGMAGAVEETCMQEVRALFETNFFGALQLTQLVLPLMRKQGSGHIFQISSHGGFKAFPGFGLYNASKFALEGMSEALAQEVAGLGIKVTVVEPGPFRTNFAGKGFVMAHKTIEAYQETAGRFRQAMQEKHGKQEGDPQKAAEAIWQISQSDSPPLRLPLGKTAIATITQKLKSVEADLKANEHLAREAVFKEG